jgi:hypothetical protein
MLVLGMAAGCRGSCGDDRAAAPDPHAGSQRPLAGVYPEQWKCDSIATPAALGELFGGTVRPVESALPVERGLPRPCTYEVSARELEFWTFDIDCREGMKQRADALFEQYKEQSREAIELYTLRATGSGSGAKPRDAGVELRPPEPAVVVAVGAKGLDHRGQGLIFIDDDAPCYVRVVGKDAARRLELAKLIAKNLTFANAPMTPRAPQ